MVSSTRVDFLCIRRSARRLIARCNLWNATTCTVDRRKRRDGIHGHPSRSAFLFKHIELTLFALEILFGLIASLHACDKAAFGGGRVGTE